MEFFMERTTGSPIQIHTFTFLTHFSPIQKLFSKQKQHTLETLNKDFNRWVKRFQPVCGENCQVLTSIERKSFVRL